MVRLLGGAAAHRPTLAAARAGARELLRDPRAVDPSLADPYVRLAARHGDQRLYEAFQRARQRAKTPQQARRYLLALTAFPDPNAVQRSLRLSLDPQVAGGEVAILLSELLANPAAQDATWKFAKRHWSRLERRMGTLLVTRFIEATPALGTAAARRDVAAFFRAHPVPTGARTVRQSLERFDRQLRFQRRAAVALRHWLSTQP
jgi:aminopeptidase N